MPTPQLTAERLLAAVEPLPHPLPPHEVARPAASFAPFEWTWTNSTNLRWTFQPDS